MSYEDSEQLDRQKRLIARGAALMFGAGTIIDLLESAIRGGETFSLAPGFGALALVALLVLFGSRLPLGAIAALGPIGVALIAYALATTKGAGDGAVLYMWPVLWEAYFFGRRGAILIVLCVGVAHGLALSAMAGGGGNLDSWIDVMVSVTVVAGVVEVLATRNRELVWRISREARIDELTHLLNRRGFDERAQIELARARREKASLGVVAFDLDHFKRVNDEFGHEIGDHVLTHLAECFRSEMRETDIAARMGGEEFVALLPGAELEEARDFAERVRGRLRSVERPGVPLVTVSAGAGAAVAPLGIEQLLKRADMALYAAKSRGRDRTVVDGPHTLGAGSPGMSVLQSQGPGPA
ncbi:MAG: diguanylate cyclase [Solirubrobacterales bacterium]